eukprot:10348337-Alexandrium_andersonii.AAC.1
MSILAHCLRNAVCILDMLGLGTRVIYMCFPHQGSSTANKSCTSLTARINIQQHEQDSCRNDCWDHAVSNSFVQFPALGQFRQPCKGLRPYPDNTYSTKPCNL